MYYRVYTCLTDLILVLKNLFIVLRILFLCEGNRRYDESEQIRIISHTRSDQTSIDTNISLSSVQITDSLYGSNRSYDWTYTYFTKLILILPIQEYP